MPGRGRTHTAKSKQTLVNGLENDREEAYHSRKVSPDVSFIETQISLTLTISSEDEEDEEEKSKRQNHEDEEDSASDECGVEGDVVIISSEDEEDEEDKSKRPNHEDEGDEEDKNKGQNNEDEEDEEDKNKRQNHEDEEDCASDECGVEGDVVIISSEDEEDEEDKSKRPDHEDEGDKEDKSKRPNHEDEGDKEDKNKRPNHEDEEDEDGQSKRPNHEDEEDKNKRHNHEDEEDCASDECGVEGAVVEELKAVCFEEDDGRAAKKREPNTSRGKRVAERKQTPAKERSVKENDKQIQEKGAEITKETQKSTRRKPPVKKSTSVTTEVQVQTKADGIVKGARPKVPATRAKSPEDEEVDDETVKRVAAKPPVKSKAVKAMKELSLEDYETADASKVKEQSAILYGTLEKLKIRMYEKSKASEVINKIEEVIVKHLKNNTLCFKQVHPPIHTGSYYENLKISNPDEFDIMFPIPVDRVDIQPFSDDGAFYSAQIKRGFTPLNKFLSESKLLPASEILQEFRSEVIKSIKKFPGVEINKKKSGCPAVTLDIQVDSRLISLDIVLCILIKSSWPDFTKDGLKIEGWLGRKMKLKYKYFPYYLVSKYEGRGTVEHNGVLAKDAWRVSFSHVEKDILLNHGSEKTCCEKDGSRCCRKDCLKLLKHLLSLLKDQNKAFDKFCSYHAKTTLLHACCSRNKDSQWAAADLNQCFEQLLKDFEENLERHQLSNFFIPTQNLLSGCSKTSCKLLAKRIREQREGGFPIFNSEN